jgi:hypothetical protein
MYDEQLSLRGDPRYDEQLSLHGGPSYDEQLSLHGGPRYDEEPRPEHDPHEVDVLDPCALVHPHLKDLVLGQLDNVAATADEETVFFPAKDDSGATAAGAGGGVAEGEQVGPGHGNGDAINLREAVWKEKKLKYPIK